MKLVEIRPRGKKRTAIALHPMVTVLRDLDHGARHSWATDLTRALQGERAGTIDVEIEVGGKRQVLTPDVAKRIGLARGCEVSVLAVDLPGARVATAAADVAVGEDPPEVVEAVGRLRDLESRIAEAERAERSLTEEHTRAGADIDRQAKGQVPGLEDHLESARTESARAQRALDDAETHLRRLQEEAAAKREELRLTLERLQGERDAVAAEGAELAGRMVATGDPGDPGPVEAALNGLRRLKTVKPRPSSRAIELAGEWETTRSRLAAMPAPTSAPESQVNDAISAIHAAQQEVAAAESGEGLDIAPAKVERLEHAHRELLEAEQRATRKANKVNRGRLEVAREDELDALAALGLKTFGEYLQRVAPNLGGDRRGDADRLRAARSALAEAESRWAELHDGQAPPEWTEAKSEEATLRQRALELLGRHVADGDLAEALRAHTETVVNTGWAERALVAALREADDIAVTDDADPEEVAEQWLAESPARREARRALEAEMAALDPRLAAAEERLAAFMQRTAPADGAAASEPPDTDADPSLERLRTRAAEAETGRREAEEALESARARASAADEKEAKLAELGRSSEEKRRYLDGLRADLERAQASVISAQAMAAGTRAAADAERAAEKARIAANGGLDLSGVVAMEAEAYLLARVTALRGAAGGPLPLVLDGTMFEALPERANLRICRLLGRLADSMQLVVLGDGGEIAKWAEGLGDRAAVRSVAR